MNEIVSCPFCGGGASIYASSDHSTAWEGGCGNEQCKVSPGVWELTEAEAVAAWNTRAALASQAQPEQPDSVHQTSDAVVCAATAQPSEEALTNAYAEGRKDEHGDCIELIAWAYKKLHHANYQRMEDALMLDRMKLLLEHGIHA